MLWFGIARNHLDAIRKCHLGTDYIFDPLANRKFAVPNDVMQEIISMADFALGNPEIVVSDYVLRTRMSGRMSVSTISSSITHFNNLTGFNAQGGFQMQPVFESGLFNRIWNLEQSGFEFPVYRKNRKLPEEGYETYEYLFQRKFTSIKALSTYIAKYRSYIEYFKK